MWKKINNTSWDHSGSDRTNDLQYCGQNNSCLRSLHHFIEVSWIENIQTMLNCTQLLTLQLQNQYILLLHVQQFAHNVEDMLQK